MIALQSKNKFVYLVILIRNENSVGHLIVSELKPRSWSKTRARANTSLRILPPRSLSLLFKHLLLTTFYFFGTKDLLLLVHEMF